MILQSNRLDLSIRELGLSTDITRFKKSKHSYKATLCIVGLFRALSWSICPGLVQSRSGAASQGQEEPRNSAQMEVNCAWSSVELCLDLCWTKSRWGSAISVLSIRLYYFILWLVFPCGLSLWVNDCDRLLRTRLPMVVAPPLYGVPAPYCPIESGPCKRSCQSPAANHLLSIISLERIQFL